MSKRSSRARLEAHRARLAAVGNSEQRRAEKRARRFALPAMAWGDDFARRLDSGKLPEMRDGVMHSGYSPNAVYSHRNGVVVTGVSGVSDRQLYGSRVDQYRVQRDAAKVAKRQERAALEQAARAERARLQAERAKREGSGWA